jgi:hypothetical protein
MARGPTAQKAGNKTAAKRQTGTSAQRSNQDMPTRQHWNTLNKAHNALGKALQPFQPFMQTGNGRRGGGGTGTGGQRTTA